MLHLVNPHKSAPIQGSPRSTEERALPLLRGLLLLVIVYAGLWLASR